MNETEFKIALNERLCDLAELFLYQYDPCRIRGGACLAGDPNPCCVYTRFNENGKAEGCPHWKGQCNYRNIWCRHWLCDTAVKSTKSECFEVIKRIQEIGRSFGLIGEPFFGSSYKGADKPL